MVELGEPIKVVDQANIVTLHRNTSRDEHTPEDSLRVQFDSLQQTHLLLLLRRGLRILNDRLHRGVGARARTSVWLIHPRNSVLRLGFGHGGGGSCCQERE